VELGAFAQCALDPDEAAVFEDDLPRDGQAEAGAGLLQRFRVGAAEVGGEELLQVGFADAEAGIGNGEMHRRAEVAVFRVQVALADTGGDGDRAAVRGVFVGVAEDVGQHLQQAVLIRLNER